MLKNLTSQAQKILEDQFKLLPENPNKEELRLAMVGVLQVAMEAAAKDAIQNTLLVKRIIQTPDTRGYNQAQYEQEVKINSYLQN